MSQQAVTAGLGQQGHRRGLPVDLGDVHQHHGRVGAGGSRHHVAGVLLVAWGVGDDELACLGREVSVGHVNGDALLAFGFQAVRQQRQVDGSAGGALFQRIQLVSQDGAAVEQQAADQGALAIVHAAGCQEAQGLVCQLLASFVVNHGAHQK